MASASASPSVSPSVSPSRSPSVSPSVSPSRSPSVSPSVSPSASPSLSPSTSLSPSRSPSKSPSVSPSISPSASPSAAETTQVIPSTTSQVRGVRLVEWQLTRDGDTGLQVSLPNYPIKSVQVKGSFSGATVTIQGSNATTPSWVTLNDAGGTALTFTSGAVKQIRENTYWIRPIVTGGDANTSSIEIYLLAVTER